MKHDSKHAVTVHPNVVFYIWIFQGWDQDSVRRSNQAKLYFDFSTKAAKIAMKLKCKQCFECFFFLIYRFVSGLSQGWGQYIKSRKMFFDFYRATVIISKECKNVSCADLERGGGGGGSGNPRNLHILPKKYISSNVWVAFPPLRKMFRLDPAEKKVSGSAPACVELKI